MVYNQHAVPEESGVKHLVPTKHTGIVATNIIMVLLRSGKTFEVIIPSWRTQRSGDDWCSNATVVSFEEIQQ
jgi:hypothetical protein